MVAGETAPVMVRLLAATPVDSELFVTGVNGSYPPQEPQMKLTAIILLGAGLSGGIAVPVPAQAGMDMFQKKAIAAFFKPVVGHGVVYEEQRNGKKETSELTIVGKETVAGKDGYWMETGMADKEAGGIVYGKVLVTPDDFQFHRSVSQMPGQPPTEYTFTTDTRKPKAKNDQDKWHEVGTETITVPAGTFVCEHWAKDDGKDDVWLSAKASPMGLVKEVSLGRTTLLVKVITDAKDHITGTPRKFDAAEMKRQMTEQMQQKKP